MSDSVFTHICARLGSCGCLTDLPVGSLVLPKASIAVTRNLDFDFANGDHWRVPYRLSKPVRRFATKYRFADNEIPLKIPADSDLVLTVRYVSRITIV